MNSSLPVLSIALVTGEGIEPAGLPVLTACVTKEGDYFIISGRKEIEKALNESLKHLEEPNSTVLFLAVKVIPANRRPRRREIRGGDAS